MIRFGNFGHCPGHNKMGGLKAHRLQHASVSHLSVFIRTINGE
jgi:hypothetical protein